LQLNWHKGPAGQWVTLEEMDLAGLDAYVAQHGVFVVWRGGDVSQMSVVLYVGRGAIRRELMDCRRDPLFNGARGLRVTWASVDPGDVDGVAAYLYEQLRPLWGEVVPNVQPLAVNLPATA
jgi:hypothetical protein